MMKSLRQLAFKEKRFNLIMDLEIELQDHRVTHFFALLARWPVMVKVNGEANEPGSRQKSTVFPNIVLIAMSSVIQGYPMKTHPLTSHYLPRVPPWGSDLL